MKAHSLLRSFRQLAKTESTSSKLQQANQDLHNTRNYGLYLVAAVWLLAISATKWTEDQHANKWTKEQQRQNNTPSPSAFP